VDLAENPHQIPFSFQMLVTAYENIAVQWLAGREEIDRNLQQGEAVLVGENVRFLTETELLEGATASLDRRMALQKALVQLGVSPADAQSISAGDLGVSGGGGHEAEILNRIRNLQAQRGSSFAEAMKEFFTDPTRLANLATTLASGQFATAAADMGYTAFDAASRDLPFLKNLDPLAVDLTGLARMQDLGIDITGHTARIFKSSFSSVGANLLGSAAKTTIATESSP